jgi:YesN/AraC family two-component response regulator
MQNSAVQLEIRNKLNKARAKNQQNFFVHPSYEMERKLLKAISRGRIQEAEGVLDRINSQKRATLAKNPIRSLKNSIIASCTLFTRAIIEGGVNPEHAFSLSDVFILQIEETDDKESLEKLEYEMLHEFVRMLIREKSPSYSSIVNKAIAFIQEQMLHPLTLDRIARHVNVHPAHLSKIFKREVGVSVTEYVAQKRIEESKYLLLYSDAKISDIALQIGFCNQSYYTKVFKKYTSMTPLHFRNRHAQT